MTCAIHSAGTIELYFYGELSNAERADLEAHVKHCVVCRQALDDLALIRDALASRPDVAAPPGGDWSGFMTRLNSSVAQLREADRPQTAGRILFGRWPRSRVAALAAAAAVVTLVTASVFLLLRQGAGILPSSPAAVDVRAPGTAPATPPGVQPDVALASLTDAHFERSKVVVLGLATRDSDNLRAEWSRERELAAALLNDTRLYRMAAEDRGMKTLAGVMRDLELVLLQTSMSEAADATSIEQLQRLIRRRDLLTKMNVVAASGP